MIAVLSLSSGLLRSIPVTSAPSEPAIGVIVMLDTMLVPMVIDAHIKSKDSGEYSLVGRPGCGWLRSRESGLRELQ